MQQEPMNHWEEPSVVLSVKQNANNHEGKKEVRLSGGCNMNLDAKSICSEFILTSMSHMGKC